MKCILSLMLASGLAAPAAAAVSVSFVPTNAVFSNGVLSNNGAPSYDSFSPTSKRVRWGTAIAPNTQQSSYTISANVVDPVSVEAATNSPLFQFANFAHDNFPVTLPALTYVKLTITGDIFEDGVNIGSSDFVFDFFHTETVNTLNPARSAGPTIRASISMAAPTG